MVPSFRNFALWVFIFLLVIALVTLFQNTARPPGSAVAYSQLLADVDAGRIATIVLPGDKEITGTYPDGRSFWTYEPSDPQLAARLAQRGVQVSVKRVPPSDTTPWFIALIVNWLPILVFIGAWIFLSRQLQQGGPGGRGPGQQ